MKKFLTLIITCFLSLSLAGCSNSKNNDDILTFFDALGNTLNLKSVQINGTLDMKDSKMNIDAQILQKEDLQVATSIGLVAGDHVKNNFLNFYIKDGKTYLNSMGTKTQSTVDKIGLKKNSKLNTYNPFLDLTDDQLCELFDSSKKENDTYKIETNNGVIEAKYICNAAGVFADKVNEMCNEKTFEITPNKGEYYLMDKSQGNLVNHVIFQCPNEKGKGVLVAPTVHGNLIVGPDSQPSAANDVSTTKQGLDFVRNTALKSVPGINFRESIRNFAGVRARTADHDFHIYEDKNNKGFINIAGMQSPGLSSACAIAPDILKMLENSGLTLEAKEDIVDERHIDRFKHLSHEDRAKLVEKNPAFGKIICRCETITEGEIINAVHRPIPATSIDAVKRRCNAGMGRCQGGFCGPRVQEIIARELNKPLADIPQDRLGTNIITGETKDGGAK